MTGICIAELVVCGRAAAQDVTVTQNVERISRREIARREAALPRGEEALARGQLAMQNQNYTLAHEEFRSAVTYLPDGSVSGKSRAQAIEGFCESGILLAKQRIAEGKYMEAESICVEILSVRYDPHCKEASELLTNLRTPGYYNRTTGPKFIAKVEEVKQLLTDAEGYYNSGRYDLAFKKYDQVLALDPYNAAARRGQERIDNTKYRYNDEAYNESRARALWQVQKGWEQPVRQYGQTVGPLADAFQKDITGTARISNKLQTIIIPRVEFRDASVREAIEFLRQQAAANDPTTDGRKGVDIVLRLTPLGQIAPPPVPVQPAAPPPATGVTPAPGELVPPPGATPAAPPPVVAPAIVAAPAISPSDARITITLTQIPLGEALRYVASQAGLKVKVEPYAVSIIPISEQTQDLITKEYKVPPGFLTATLNAGATTLNAPAKQSGVGTGTAKDTVESTGGRQLVNRESAKDFLESQGVTFDIKGSGAQFLPASSRLVVRNTPDQLELVDAIVEQASVAGPKQVEIESKFIEITQNNLKELGFDWLLGPFNIGNHKLFGTGGTPVVAGPEAANFPLSQNVNGTPVAVGGFPVTGGNRSGGMAISANALDALLFPTLGASAVAPGIFGLAGVFTDPQFQVVIRALNQKKGVDLLSAPRVTTKSGQRAIIEVVREFRYPTEFTPPQVPNITGGGSGTGNVTISVVTPTTPQKFETRNTGVTLEVEPVVGPDGLTIDLNLVPQVVEFEGFINYGSQIFGINPSATAALNSRVLLTENVINQPIFSSRKVTTSVSVWDGQTVVLGGLIREDVQKTEDRTPIVGDIPLVGRLFRTNTDQHIKRNLIIFVTARLVNPGGQPVNAVEEEEEKEGLLEPPTLPQVPMYKK